MTGATTSTSSDPSRRKQTISLVRGRLSRFALLAHAYCCASGTPERLLAWEMWPEFADQSVVRYTSCPCGGVPGSDVGNGWPKVHTRTAPGSGYQLSSATM